MPADSLEQIVYQNLRRAILAHKLSPGTPLPAPEIAQALGVSRTPVQAALRRLAVEGLVSFRPRHGASVVQPTARDVRDAFVVRCNLEALAAELAAREITREEIGILENCILEEEAAFARRDAEGVLEAGRRFHEVIAHASRNRVLARVTTEVVAQTYVYLMFYDPFDAPVPRSPPEHRAIVAALTQRDPAEAHKAMEEHVRSTLGYLDLGLYFRAGRDVAEALRRQKNDHSGVQGDNRQRGDDL